MRFRCGDAGFLDEAVISSPLSAKTAPRRRGAGYGPYRLPAAMEPP
ncbi:hypothetical protein AZ22_1870 [Bordetella bronchiseptica 980-2]|nr:hypothetical protein AZ22_1870 [Bordetella bronchiseptica 980-2]KDC77767.1 hypothetical protein L514_1827 [Bordetella bronchiseptica MBORD635]KDC89674.1 hypothetical protein L516_1756 [Bordetella bronchiseptica MBORD668]KDD17671.1 hypothetical protein L523_1825 [Bordetella bronchiseptica MBORD731]KDD20897.1 hypothetical protein L525_1877 [Bordetella bronchiseptica MBORD782]